MIEKTGTCVSNEKEKVNESQSRSVTPRSTPTSGAGSGESHLTIEREIEDARSTQDASVSSKRKDNWSSSNLGKSQRASSSRGSQSRDHPGMGQMKVAGQAGQMVCYHC